MRAKKIQCLLLMTFVLFQLNAQSTLALGRESASLNKIQVVVIGVPSFAISKYNTPELSKTIVQRCADIKKFFEQRFSDSQLTYQEFCSPEKTTQASLKRLLEIDLPKLASGTLTFLFIITHGETESHPGAPVSQDLRIVASDTVENDFEFTSIPISTGLIPWMQKIPSGSTIFTFLDTCHSGAATNKIVSLSAEAQRQLGVKMMIMASSLPQQKAYNASFTAGLLSLWNRVNDDDACLVAPAMIQPLRREIENLVNIPLSAEEGFATFIVEYEGPVCFNNFGRDGKLLFVYAGNAFPSASWIIYQETTDKLKQIKVSTLDKKSFDLARLDAGIYKVDLIKDGQATRVPETIDLREKSTEVIWLSDKPPDLSTLAAFTKEMADLSERSGVSGSEVASLRLRSASSFLLASDLTSAQTVLRLLPPAYSSIPIVEKYTNAGGTFNLSVEEVKKDLSKSAAFLAQTAQALPNGIEKSDFALEAYLMYGMAAAPKRAKQVREKFHLDLDDDTKDLIQAEANARKVQSPVNNLRFQILSTMKSVENATSISSVKSIASLKEN